MSRSKTKEPPIKIEKNVPLPMRSKVPPLPLEQLAVGDSFLLKVKDKTFRATVRQRLYRHQKANPNVRLSMRTVDKDTVRIFRLEDHQ